VIHTAQCDSPLSPPTMTQRIRTTISLSPDVHEIFKRMSDVSGLSVSRCMGDWLAETADGAQHVSLQLQRAKEASLDGIRQLHSSLKKGAILDENATLAAVQSAARGAVAGGRLAARPPYSNTGVKSPSAGKTGGRKSK
jgi:hypothetical protein